MHQHPCLKKKRNNSFFIWLVKLIVFFSFQGIAPELHEGLISVNEILEVSSVHSPIYR